MDEADESVYVGNAGRDASLDRGWLLGHFKEIGDPRHSEDVEIKWGVHPRGEERERWVQGELRTALLVLISGRFRIELPGRSVLLEHQGDYVVWGRGVDHRWEVPEVVRHDDLRRAPDRGGQHMAVVRVGQADGLDLAWTMPDCPRRISGSRSVLG